MRERASWPLSGSRVVRGRGIACVMGHHWAHNPVRGVGEQGVCPWLGNPMGSEQPARGTRSCLYSARRGTGGCARACTIEQEFERMTQTIRKFMATIRPSPYGHLHSPFSPTSVPAEWPPFCGGRGGAASCRYEGDCSCFGQQPVLPYHIIYNL